MTGGKLSLYVHTLRHLKPQQFIWRGLNLLPKRKPHLRQTPPLRDLPAALQQDILKPDSLHLPDRFCFLNEEGSLPDIGWQGDGKSALWRYNQHYFDWLGSAAARAAPAAFAAMTEAWMAANPPAAGPGWDPYPTSLRIVNWAKAQLRGDSLSDRMLDSLALQAQHLSRSVEWHLMANHLFANGKALVFAGVLFDGPAAEKWLAQGLRILDAQLDEQVLEDGGHFELSPMYHAIILEDGLDLLNLLAAAALPQAAGVQQKLCNRLPDMLHWLDAMCLPDGEIPFFNDATFGIAAAPQALRDYAARLGIAGPAVEAGFVHLAASGYVRHAGDSHTAILDVGPVGPDYQPGHAHADVLSFELAVFGNRLLVNSGIDCYGISAERLRQRGTAAHNTVVVGGTDSSEVWSGFRVARRAQPRDLHLDRENSLVSCGHDGYFRIQGQPMHRRMWRFGTDHMEIEDAIDGACGAAEAFFRIHPDWHVELTGNEAVCRHGDKQVRLTFGGGTAEKCTSSYHPGFNLSREAACLRVRLHDDRLVTAVAW